MPFVHLFFLLKYLYSNALLPVAQPYNLTGFDQSTYSSLSLSPLADIHQIPSNYYNIVHFIPRPVTAVFPTDLGSLRILMTSPPLTLSMNLHLPICFIAVSKWVVQTSTLGCQRTTQKPHKSSAQARPGERQLWLGTLKRCLNMEKDGSHESIGMDIQITKICGSTYQVELEWLMINSTQYNETQIW